MSEERTALYRMYDGAGRLLYVGISRDPDVRWEQHQYWSSSWQGSVARSVVEWHASRTLALSAEEEAIQTERPIYNKALNWEVAVQPVWPSLARAGRQKALKLADLIRSEIVEGRWRPGQKLPSRAALAKAAQVGQSAAAHATSTLIREGALIFRSGAGTFVASA